MEQNGIELNRTPQSKMEQKRTWETKQNTIDQNMQLNRR